MKSAKELFEELGFKGIESDYSLIYRYMGTEIDCEVHFYLTTKEYEYTVENYVINMKLHKAIHKQCEELGWL